MQLFVNNLTNVDFSYLHPTRGLVGETWLASIVLDGKLDDNGMVCDFGVVKKTLRHWLDSQIDHCLLVPSDAKNLKKLFRKNEETSLEWQIDNKRSLTLKSPDQAVSIINTDDITPQSVAKWCKEKLQPFFNETVENITLTFENENIQTPFYHYSHGLKKHDGNCQRIAHGHRSKIEIWRDGEISEQDMTYWANKWQDIYIGTKEDITGESASQTRFAYRSAQGNFELSLPKECVDIIKTDTTVEFIATHIANTLKQNNPQCSFVVKAYEGLAKGAIAKA